MTSTPSEYWSGRSVLVTGATGLLGGWLVADLLDRGARVIALIRNGAPGSQFLREGMDRRCVTVNGALDDQALLLRTLCEYEVATVFHLGAQTLVGVGKADPVGTLDANIRGTWNLLEAVRRAAGDICVVFASSDKAYGRSDNLPYRETDPMRGTYPYDVSKSCADLICGMYATTYGLPVGITRCANLFGGGDLNFSRTVPGVIRATLAGERFRIRSDGLFVRDMLYVKDAAAAYLLLARRLDEERALSGEAFNFSMELKLTVLDVAGKVRAMMNRSDLEPIIENRASNEIRAQFLSTEKARTQLSWSPTYTLEESLAETIEWYTTYLGVS